MNVKYTFKENTPQDVIAKVRELQNKFESMRVHLYGKFCIHNHGASTKMNEEFTQNLKYIQQWNSAQFIGPKKHKNVDKTYQLLQQINHIDFSMLKNLLLDFCQIDNIQPLSSTNITQLKYLNLRKNKIKSLKPLGHMFTPNLQRIDISYNLYRQNQTIYAARMCCFLQRLWDSKEGYYIEKRKMLDISENIYKNDFNQRF